MKKVTQNGTVASHERYLYRGYLQIATLDMLNSRNVLRTLLWDPLEEVATRPLALVRDNALYCYGTDFNKNVAEVFDGEGSIVATYDYSPYGQVVSTEDLVQPVQWSSEMNDYELALVYYNYLYYNPIDSRWINRDPIAEEGGWNLYGFVGNNACKYNDVRGCISYVQIDSFVGHAWIRTGAQYYFKDVVMIENNAYYLEAIIPDGVGFYPANAKKDFLSGLLTFALTSHKGQWKKEDAKEILYLLGTFDMTEYDVKTYTSMWRTPKMKYGEPGKCCKSATEKEKTACLNEHPEYASPSSYNLITGNCRDKAEKVLKECCMEIVSG